MEDANNISLAKTKCTYKYIKHHNLYCAKEHHIDLHSHIRTNLYIGNSNVSGWTCLWRHTNFPRCKKSHSHVYISTHGSNLSTEIMITKFTQY